MKLAIVGTRNRVGLIRSGRNSYSTKSIPTEIQMVISGGAKGVDTFSKLFAARHHKPYMEFAPQYNVYGRYATLKRNTQIVKEATRNRIPIRRVQRNLSFHQRRRNDSVGVS